MLQRQAGNGKVIVETSENVPENILNYLRSLPKVTVESPTDRILELSLSNGTAISDIVSFLTERGVKIEQVRRSEASLEDIYARILKEGEAKK